MSCQFARAYRQSEQRSNKWLLDIGCHCPLQQYLDAEKDLRKADQKPATVARRELAARRLADL
jgi:hypothetical protein